MILSDKKLPVILRVRMAHVYKTKQSSIRGPKCVNRVYLGSRSVAAVGIRILAGVHVNRRSSIIIAVSLGLGLSVTFAPDILRSLPELLSHTLSSGIATGGTRVLVPNTVFPGERCLDPRPRGCRLAFFLLRARLSRYNPTPLLGFHSSKWNRT